MGMISGAKKRIVIASVLKPVNDTRMMEKLGYSLAKAAPFEVSIIGFPASIDESGNINFQQLPYFKRVSFRRLLMPWYVLQKTIRLKPQLLIVTTHELLLISILARWITGTKVIYDIQENYYRNIMFTSAFPGVIRPVLAVYVRLKERLTVPLVDHFFLAEKSYVDELPFAGKKFTVLENKLKKPRPVLKTGRNKYQLLFSGTLAKSTGVFKAIEIARLLHEIEPRISLVIVGYCAQRSELEKIQQAIGPFPFIRLTGGDRLVPHEIILAEIQRSGAGIIAYPKNRSTGGSIPTKLYEYLGMQLPILLVDHAPWVELCRRWHAAFVFDPETFDARAALNALQTQHFYPNEPGDVYWESEESKLVARVKKVIG